VIVRGGRAIFRPDEVARVKGESGDPTSDVLDAKTLEGLHKLEADAGMPLLADLMHTFREDSQKRIATLHEAMRAGDADSMRVAAHGLRGSAGALGAMRLAARATELEETAEGGAIERCGGLLVLVEREAALAIEALEHALSPREGAPREGAAQEGAAQPNARKG
jgi:HPt (histidine-containing phosphotransfer) domain-containing protein